MTEQSDQNLRESYEHSKMSKLCLDYLERLLDEDEEAKIEVLNQRYKMSCSERELLSAVANLLAIRDLKTQLKENILQYENERKEQDE